MTTTVPGFPNSFQTSYVDISKAPLPGDLWESELYNERPIGGLVSKVTEVAYAATVTIGAFNSGDEVGITVNGVTVAVTAVTDATATAALLNTAINAAALLSGVLSSTVAGPALTLAGALGVSITASEYSPDATTATFSAVTASVVQPKLCFGYGVVRDIPSASFNHNAIKIPGSATDKFVGVLTRTRGGQIPPAQIEAAGFNINYLVPGMTYAVLRENAGVVVEFVGTAPVESDSVYLIFSGTNAGKWSATSGGVSQVTRGDVQFSTTDPVGLIVDSLPTLFVASNTSDDQTATDLRNAWNASAQHFAVATATIDTSGAESYIILTFNDFASHTVTAYSPATADITGITNTTTSVAATAVLIPDYSWGRPSIPGSADLPARAFLRLSPS